MPFIFTIRKKGYITKETRRNIAVDLLTTHHFSFPSTEWSGAFAPYKERPGKGFTSKSGFRTIPVKNLTELHATLQLFVSIKIPWVLMQSNLSGGQRQYLFWKPVDNFIPEMEYLSALYHPEIIQIPLYPFRIHHANPASKKLSS